jgi:O-antigen/teichoic acid export membrane protein
VGSAAHVTANRTGGFAVSRQITWVVARVVGQALEFVALVWFARQLGARQFGELSVGVLIARYGGLVGDWGALIRGARDVASCGTDSPVVASLVRRRQRLSAALSILFAAVCLVVAPALAPLALVLFQKGAHRDWIALGQGRAMRAAAPPLVGGLILMVVGLGVHSELAASWTLGASAVLGMTLSYALNRLPRHVARARVAVDGWYMATTLADQVCSTSDTFLLLILRSATQAGVYSAVYRLPNAWLLLMGLLVSAAIPSITVTLRQHGGALPDLWRRAAGFGLVLSTVLAGLGAVSLMSMTWIFGEDYASGRTALVVLLIAAGFTTASAPFRGMCAALGRDRAVGVATIVVAALNLMANVAVIPVAGMVGAATTTAIAQLALLGFYATASRRSRPAVFMGEVTGRSESGVALPA